MVSDDERYELPCKLCLLVGAGLNWALAIAMAREYFAVPLGSSTLAALAALLRWQSYL